MMNEYELIHESTYVEEEIVEVRKELGSPTISEAPVPEPVKEPTPEPEPIPTKEFPVESEMDEKPEDLPPPEEESSSEIQLESEEIQMEFNTKSQRLSKVNENANNVITNKRPSLF